MTDTISTPLAGTAASMGFISRVVGSLMSPRAAYADIAARPRWLGALLLGIVVVAGTTFAFLSTRVGQEALLEQQYQSMEWFESLGVRMPPEAYAGMEEAVPRARYITVASQIIVIPLTAAAVAGLMIVVFNFVMGGEARYRQVFAVVSFAGLVLAVGAVFATPLNYAKGAMASRANLGLFLPFLADTSFPARVLGFIDLFWVWWMVNLAIGLGVLYKRKTGPIATTFLVLYAAVAVLIAAFRAFAGA